MFHSSFNINNITAECGLNWCCSFILNTKHFFTLYSSPFENQFFNFGIFQIPFVFVSKILTVFLFFVLLLQRRNMSSSPEKREHLYKILVIGELGTGKTSFIKRYVHQYFSPNYRATIGVDFALKVLNWDQNTIIRLQLWDIAGKIVCLKF